MPSFSDKTNQHSVFNSNMDTQRAFPKSMSKRSKVKRRQNSVKIVYISTPMKVKTSASQFRTLVQELTGRDSDMARLMIETNYHQDGVVGKDFVDVYDGFGKGLPSYIKEEEKSPRESPTASSSDGIFGYQEQSFVGEEFMIPLDFVFGSSEFDVLGSYDVL